MFLENNYAFNEGADLSTYQIDKVNNMISEAFEHILITNMVDTSYAIQEESQYLLQEGAEGFWNRIKSFLKMIWEGIKSIWENIVSFFKGNTFKKLDEKMKKLILLANGKTDKAGNVTKQPTEAINKGNHNYSSTVFNDIDTVYKNIQEAITLFITIKDTALRNQVSKLKSKDLTSGDIEKLKNRELAKSAYYSQGSNISSDGKLSNKSVDNVSGSFSIRGNLEMFDRFNSKSNILIYDTKKLKAYYDQQKVIFSDKTFEKLKKAKKILDTNYSVANDYYNVHKNEYNENIKADFTNFIQFLKNSVKDCGDIIKLTKQALSMSIKLADNTLAYFGQKSNVKDSEIDSWNYK